MITTEPVKVASATQRVAVGAPNKLDPVKFMPQEKPNQPTTQSSAMTWAAARASLQDPQSQLLYEFPDGRILMRVFFATNGRAVVRPDDGLQQLESKARQADRIQVRGFTDSMGSPTYNQKLGMLRAKGVAAFLRARGVPTERIIVESRGESEFLANNQTSDGRAMNRRVEILMQNNGATQ